MKVQISFSEWFKRFVGSSEERELELDHGTTAIQAAVAAGIPREEVGFVTVNNVKAEEELILKEGDKLRVYPMIIGG